jgi:hypothetical protein
MKQLFLMMITVLLITGCSSRCDEQQPFSLQGAWMLQQVCTPEGHIYHYMPNDQTRLRIYQGDSAMFECKLIQTEQALVVEPQNKSSVTLFDKGGDEYLYMEGDELRPIKVINDSVITIQQIGRVFTWQRADSIGEEWADEIRTIIDRHMEYERPFDAPHSYVLSAKEREQANVIHLLEYATIGCIIVLLSIAHIAQVNRKAKKRLQLQLQQIQEIHDELPQPVKQAIENVESAYFSSDEYYTLQHRITSGQRLKDEEWYEIETQLKKVYPGFSSQLRNLHVMSELEYQTCLLIKLRIAPTDIATILSRDTSTISTVRSRLYKKVFDKKGGAREWDEFIMSIGA